MAGTGKIWGGKGNTWSGKVRDRVEKVKSSRIERMDVGEAIADCGLGVVGVGLCVEWNGTLWESGEVFMVALGCGICMDKGRAENGND